MKAAKYPNCSLTACRSRTRHWNKEEGLPLGTNGQPCVSSRWVTGGNRQRLTKLLA